MSINRLEIIGHLGRDPEIEEVAGDRTVARLSIATERGGDSEKTDWHRATAWGSLAEVCEEYLRKGDRVFVAGPLTYSRWKDDAGQTRKSAELQVRRMEMLGSPSGSRDRTEPREEARKPSREEKRVPGATEGGPGQETVPDDAPQDDSLPF